MQKSQRVDHAGVQRVLILTGKQIGCNFDGWQWGPSSFHNSALVTTRFLYLSCAAVAAWTAPECLTERSRACAALCSSRASTDCLLPHRRRHHYCRRRCYRRRRRHHHHPRPCSATAITLASAITIAAAIAARIAITAALDIAAAVAIATADFAIAPTVLRHTRRHPLRWRPGVNCCRAVAAPFCIVCTYV